jgi:hypothetical protein
MSLLDAGGRHVLDDLVDPRRGFMTQTTGADGAVELGPLAPGTYRAAAALGETRSEAVEVSIAAGATAEAAILLAGP